MKRLLAGVSAAVLLSPAMASAASGAQCAAQWDELAKAHQTGSLSRTVFVKNCLAGTAPSVTPIIDPPAGAPAAASFRCRDGFYASSPAGCLTHRGVAAKLR